MLQVKGRQVRVGERPVCVQAAKATGTSRAIVVRANNNVSVFLLSLSEICLFSATHSQFIPVKLPLKNFALVVCNCTYMSSDVWCNQGGCLNEGRKLKCMSCWQSSNFLHLQLINLHQQVSVPIPKCSFLKVLKNPPFPVMRNVELIVCAAAF